MLPELFYQDGDGIGWRVFDIVFQSMLYGSFVVGWFL